MPMMNDNLHPQTMNIAFVCNDGYVKYVSVTMVSILQNHPGVNIHFYLICNDISERSKRCVSQLNALFPFEVTYLTFDSERFSELNETHNLHLPDETYIRYFIADLIPNVDRLLLLIGELVVDRSLMGWYNVNLGNLLIAAAKDPLDRGMKAWFEKFNIPPEYPYLNTGILLINAKRWREWHLGERLLQTAQEWGDLFWFPEQDAINVLCYDKNFLISQKYNFCCELNWDNLDDRAEAGKNTVIYRWAGPQKPWANAKCNHTHLFWKYARLSPFYEEILYKNLKVSSVQNITQHIRQVADIALLRNINNYSNNRFNYYRNMMLTVITFGKLRQYYAQRANAYKEKIQSVRKIWGQ